MLEVALLMFPALMAFGAAGDLLTMRIPNWLSLLLVGGFFVLAPIAGLSWQEIGLHAAAGALVLVVAFGMFAFGWIGGGDAKLAAAAALWLGFPVLLPWLAYAGLFGGALGLAILTMRRYPPPAFTLGWGWLQRLYDKRVGVPYGLALTFGALMVYAESPIWRAGTAL